MLYLGSYIQFQRGSVAGYTTDGSRVYELKERIEVFECMITNGKDIACSFYQAL